MLNFGIEVSNMLPRSMNSNRAKFHSNPFTNFGVSVQHYLFILMRGHDTDSQTDRYILNKCIFDINIDDINKIKKSAPQKKISSMHRIGPVTVLSI